jgi:hypothetical protein
LWESGGEQVVTSEVADNWIAAIAGMTVGLQGLGQRLGVHAFAALQCQHIELGWLQVARIVGGGEQAAVIKAGFHQQGKSGHLGGAVVNVQAVKVLFQYQARDGSGLVAALQVDGLEHVIGHHQNVAAATGRVQHGDGFGVERVAIFAHAGLDEGIELGLHLGRLLGGGDVVRPLFGQGALRVGHEPQAAHAVLHQVLHDPVGREELGGGGDVLRFDDLANDLVLLLADVELVQPADDFDFSPVFFRDLCHQLGNDGVAAQQVVGQQQLGVVVNALKQEGHGAGQGVALGHQQHAVQLAIAVAGEFEFGDFGFVQAWEFAGQVCGVGKDVWQPPGGAGQCPVAVAQVVVQLHVAQRGKAVEPGVGHGFHGVGKAVFADALDQLVALAADFGGPGLTGDDGDIALGLGGGHFQRASLVG